MSVIEATKIAMSDEREIVVPCPSRSCFVHIFVLAAFGCGFVGAVACGCTSIPIFSVLFKESCVLSSVGLDKFVWDEAVHQEAGRIP